ncbi:MAG: hypothetical protein RLZZ488_1215 [Pseudomonadota bacterium]|jgi:hypothetical protein
MTDTKPTEEKEWSEIRNEILKKVETFTDQQIEKVKAAIHRKTAPKGEETDVEQTLSENQEEMEVEGGRLVDDEVKGKKDHSKSA